MKILIGPSSFGEDEPAPLSLLGEAGFEVIPNPFGRRYTKKEIIELIKDVDGLIAGLEPLDAEVLQQARVLKVISRCGAGTSNIDHQAAARLGIAIYSTPDAPTDSVAELTIGAILAGLRFLPQMHASLQIGKWEKKIGRLLGEQTVAVVGCGRIGRRVIALLKPFGCRIIGVDIADVNFPEGVEQMSLRKALPEADIITLHASGETCVLSAETFAVMKDGVFLCNAARGGNVDENALVDALRTGKVAGAWLDAFCEEPYTGPLREFNQVILTPHAGSYTREGRKQMEMESVRNLMHGLAPCSSTPQ